MAFHGYLRVLGYKGSSNRLGARHEARVGSSTNDLLVVYLLFLLPVTTCRKEGKKKGRDREGGKNERKEGRKGGSGEGRKEIRYMQAHFPKHFHPLLFLILKTFVS